MSGTVLEGGVGELVGHCLKGELVSGTVLEGRNDE